MPLDSVDSAAPATGTPAATGFTGKEGMVGETGDEFAGSISAEGEVGDGEVGDAVNPAAPAVGESTLNDTFEASGCGRSAGNPVAAGFSNDDVAAPLF